MPDLLGRVGGVRDDDLLRHDREGDRSLVGLEVEGTRNLELGTWPLPVLAVPSSLVLNRLKELEDVDRGQVAGAVIEVHVLGAWVRGGNRAGVRAGVPVVDRRVVLHARVGALPRRLRDVSHQLARVVGLRGVSRLDVPRAPLSVVEG